MTPAVALLDGEPVDACSASRDAPPRADPLPGFGSPQGPDPVHMAAREAWSLLAPRIAGQPRMRVSRDRRSYPQRWEAALSAEPPRPPAAVRLYGRDGTARCLAADLDVSRGGADQVAADAVALERLVARCGGRSVTDRSPSGGRHVYVLLAEPVPYGEMRRAALALSRLLPSLDATPLLNLTAGCIRPPGAAHRSGGAQQLLTPLAGGAPGRRRRRTRRRCGPRCWTPWRRSSAPSTKPSAATTPGRRGSARGRAGRPRPRAERADDGDRPHRGAHLPLRLGSPAGGPHRGRRGRLGAARRHPAPGDRRLARPGLLLRPLRLPAPGRRARPGLAKSDRPRRPEKDWP